MKLSLRYFRAITGVMLLLVLTATLVWAAAPPALWREFLEPARTGYDPLSLTEEEWAHKASLQDPAVSALLENAQRVELLLVERHREPKARSRSDLSPRRADVYVYIYDTDILLHAIINVESGLVDSVETAQNTQLPLTKNEAALATQIALADPKVNAAVQSEYRTITGEALNDPARQLTIRPLIFRADARPDQKLDKAAACGLRRCAQLLMTTHNDFLINLLPIVDLSGRELVNANSFLEE
jgi:hypothetical protein